MDAFNLDINPYDLFWIPTKNISEITRRKRPLNYNVFGKVKEGDWDQRSEFKFSSDYPRKNWLNTVCPSVDYEESLFHKSMENHFLQGVDWEDTVYVRIEIERLGTAESVWDGCKSRSDILEKCEKIDDLFRTIKQNGYKTQRQLGDVKSYYSAKKNEIMVDIGRNGNLLWVDGRHRLSISKILDIECIPVVVGVRHKEWMDSDLIHEARQKNEIH